MGDLLSLWLPATTDCYIDQLHNVFVLVVGIVVYGLLLSNIVDALNGVKKTNNFYLITSYVVVSLGVCSLVHLPPVPMPPRGHITEMCGLECSYSQRD